MHFICICFKEKEFFFLTKKSKRNYMKKGKIYDFKLKRNNDNKRIIEPLRMKSNK